MSLIFQQATQNTSAWFQTNNLVIPKDVVALETDTGKTKVGDGIAPYNSLDYSGTIVGNKMVHNLVFTEAPAPVIEFVIGVDETFEFEFATYHATGSNEIVAASNAGNRWAAVMQIGEVVQIPNSWRRKYHTVGANHTGGNQNLQPIGFVAGSYSCNSGWGKISRRSFGGMHPGLTFDCRNQAFATGVGDTTYEYTCQAVLGIPEDDSDIKVAIGIHSEMRGFFKLRKNA